MQNVLIKYLKSECIEAGFVFINLKVDGRLIPKTKEFKTSDKQLEPPVTQFV